MKVFPRLSLENACLRMLYASLIVTSRSWRNARTPIDIWWELEVSKSGVSIGESGHNLKKVLCILKEYTLNAITLKD